jgi:hypothetical protein
MLRQNTALSFVSQIGADSVTKTVALVIILWPFSSSIVPLIATYLGGRAWK